MWRPSFIYTDRATNFLSVFTYSNCPGEYFLGVKFNWKSSIFVLNAKDMRHYSVWCEKWKRCANENVGRKKNPACREIIFFVYFVVLSHQKKRIILWLHFFSFWFLIIHATLVSINFVLFLFIILFFVPQIFFNRFPWREKKIITAKLQIYFYGCVYPHLDRHYHQPKRITTVVVYDDKTKCEHA